MGLRDEIVGLGKRAAGVAIDSARSSLDSLSDTLSGPGEGPDLNKAEAVTLAPEGGGKGLPQEPSEDPKTLLWDPFAVIEQLGYRERYTTISYDTLRTMVWRVPIVQGIIQTRLNQMAAFARPQHDKYSTGFRIALTKQKKEPTKAELEEAERLERLILNCGSLDADIRGRDSFEHFLRKITRDSLIFDQVNAEIIPDRKGRPAHWFAVDASTIRIADSKQQALHEMEDVRYVQVYDGAVINKYTAAEMMFGIRNPRTDIRNQGYGTSELEMLISIITSWLWAYQYNQNAFSQGTTAKGILNFKGQLPDKQLRAFRRHWYNMVSGAENAFRTPITNVMEGLEWINLQANNKEMEYSAWMDFLIKLIAGIYQMDPVEVNFKYGNSGSTQGEMFESANKSKIVDSKDKGLRPLVHFIESLLNKYIIWPINKDYTFKFVGLDARTPSEAADLAAKRVKVYLTVNEIRAEEDLEPLPDGDIILDPTYLQASQARQMQEQGGFGEEGEGGFGQEEEGDDLDRQLEGLGQEDQEQTEKSLTKSLVMDIEV